MLDYLPEFIGRVRCFADGEDLHYDIIHSHYWISGEAALALRRSWERRSFICSIRLVR